MYDQLMIDAAIVAICLDSPVSPRIVHQLTLPLSKGGFGLLSAAAAAAPAYLSAVFSSISHSKPFTDWSDVSVPLPNNTQLHSFLQHDFFLSISVIIMFMHTANW